MAPQSRAVSYTTEACIAPQNHACHHRTMASPQDYALHHGCMAGPLEPCVPPQNHEAPTEPCLGARSDALQNRTMPATTEPCPTPQTIPVATEAWIAPQKHTWHHILEQAQGSRCRTLHRHARGNWAVGSRGEVGFTGRCGTKDVPQLATSGAACTCTCTGLVCEEHV